MSELAELKAEIAALRKEIEALRSERTYYSPFQQPQRLDHYHHYTPIPTYPAYPPNWAQPYFGPSLLGTAISGGRSDSLLSQAS